MILCATIVGSSCAQPDANVEVSTPTAVTENQPQKRAIFSDCDSPAGLIGGLHSDVAVHSDLALGPHGQSYAPAYSDGYLASGGIFGGVGTLGQVGSLGGVVASPSLVSSGYAPHAPIIASSIYSSPVVSHAPVFAAPAVCHTLFFF